MEKNAQATRTATGGYMERWALMEEGRKLHDKAVFEICAKLFRRAGFSKKGRQRARRGPALTPSMAHHRLN
jgi:hypothetical protein